MFNETADILELIGNAVKDGVAKKKQFIRIVAEFTDPATNYTSIAAKMIEIGTIKKEEEFEEALEYWKTRRIVKQELGDYPKDPVDYVRLFAEKHRITLALNGLILKGGRSYTFDTLRAELIVTNYNLNLRYGGDLIGASLMRWRYQYIEALKDELRRKVAHDPGAVTRVVDDWAFIAARFREPYAADVLRKFMWSVKRKMLGLPVERPVMPVVFGTVQRQGKSKFLEWLMGTVGFCHTSFGQITDERNKTLWENFILYIGEMRKPRSNSGIDMEGVKNNITSGCISGRVMSTGITETIVNNATFIGDSNFEVRTILYDPSGMGRFIQLSWLLIAEADKEETFAAVNNLDWLAMWQSVDEMAEDPSKPWWEMIAAAQEEMRPLTTVEAWLRDPDRDIHRKLYNDRVDGNMWVGAKGAQMLHHENYVPWCEYSRYTPLNERNFSSEMMLLEETNPRLVHTKPGNRSTWRYDEEPVSNVVKLATKVRDR